MGRQPLLGGPQRRARALAGLLALMLAVPAGAAVDPDDPMGSVLWDLMHRNMLDGEPVVFDAAVRVLAPPDAEDSTQVPVMVDARALDGVQEIRIFSDFNPIPRILDLEPGELRPLVGFRFKVQQATAVRAAARTADGVWHVGSAWVEAAGGGCTAPSFASASPLWESRLGEVSGNLWSRGDDTRVRFSLIHPMDTGLAPGIPVFHLQRLSVRDAGDGAELGRLRIYEPVSENPTLTLQRPGVGGVRLEGRDNNGNRFRAELLP